MYAVFKEAFPMPLGTVATRIAKANARSFCCRLFACFSQIRYEQYCVVQVVPKIHINWELVSIVRPGFFSV